MGDHNEHIHKRLRTIESSSEAKQNTSQPKQNVEEADAFEHIKQSSECYDAQTYGTVVFLGVKSCKEQSQILKRYYLLSFFLVCFLKLYLTILALV